MQHIHQRLAQRRFLVLGRAGMDLNADPPGSRIESAIGFTAALGGSAANIAVALRKQGADVGMVSCLSDDPVGRFCRAEFARYGIDATYVRAVGGEARTSLALTETVPHDCKTVIYRNGAADFALEVSDATAPDYSRAGALVVTGTALAVEPSRGATFAALSAAKAQGAIAVLDVDYRAYSWSSRAEAALVCAEAARMCDIVVGNDEEFGLLAGSMDGGQGFASALASDGRRIAIYKQGMDGATTFASGRSFQTPIFRVDARKPTGAGDAFMGGFLMGLAAGKSLEEAVRRGAATAAIVVSGIGCAPAMPTSAGLDAFLDSRADQGETIPR